VEDQDFASQLTRDTFLEMCKPAMEKVSAVLEAAIAQCGMPVTDIDVVEMCGGASRVPWVKDMCQKAFGGKDLSHRLNADECVARGCAVQAGILSNLYKVREFKAEDISQFPVSLSWMSPQVNGDAPAAKTGVVFAANSAMNLQKIATFQRKESFELTLKYADTKVLHPGTPEEIAKYTIEVPKSESAKRVKVKASLSLHGTFSVEGAQLLEEDEKGEENAPPPADAAKPEEAAADAAKGDAAKGEKRKDESGPAKPKKRFKRTDLSVKLATPLSLTEEQLKESKTREDAMQAEMREIEAHKALRNDVEAYILSMKGGLNDNYGPFVAPGTLDGLRKTFDEAETWLYDHQDESKQVFIDKLDELKKLGDPIRNRFQEDSSRKGLIESLRLACSRNKSKAGPPARPLDPTQLRALDTARSETTAWLAGKEAGQAKLAKHQDPVLLCSELESRLQNINKLSEACDPDEPRIADDSPIPQIEEVAMVD